MDKDTKIIIVLALLGFGAFRFFKKSKSEGIEAPKSVEADFIAKVKRIQTRLGVVIDGIPASQTNGAMKSQFGLPYGNISPKNIDQYLSDLHL